MGLRSGGSVRLSYYGLSVSLVVGLMVALIAVAPREHPRVAFLPYGSSLTGWDDESVQFLVRVEPHKDNRALVMAVVDEDGFTVRRSVEQLDGDSVVTRTVYWRSVPAGALTVVAALFESSERPVATARWQVQILARR